MVPLNLLYELSIVLASALGSPARRGLGRAASAEGRLAFPLDAVRPRGRRRRAVQATYLMLAVLMGGGLVLFGIGGTCRRPARRVHRQQQRRQQRQRAGSRSASSARRPRLKASPNDRRRWRRSCADTTSWPSRRRPRARPRSPRGEGRAAPGGRLLAALREGAQTTSPTPTSRGGAASSSTQTGLNQPAKRQGRGARDRRPTRTTPRPTCCSCSTRPPPATSARRSWRRRRRSTWRRRASGSRSKRPPSNCKLPPRQQQ